MEKNALLENVRRTLNLKEPWKRFDKTGSFSKYKNSSWVAESAAADRFRYPVFMGINVDHDKVSQIVLATSIQEDLYQQHIAIHIATLGAVMKEVSPEIDDDAGEKLGEELFETVATGQLGKSKRVTVNGVEYRSEIDRSGIWTITIHLAAVQRTGELVTASEHTV